MDPVAARSSAVPPIVRRLALTVACPLAVVVLIGARHPADAALPPPPVRLPVLHGVDGWADAPASMRILSDRAAADVRIVTSPATWKV